MYTNKRTENQIWKSFAHIVGGINQEVSAITLEKLKKNIKQLLGK